MSSLEQGYGRIPPLNPDSRPPADATGKSMSPAGPRSLPRENARQAMSMAGSFQKKFSAIPLRAGLTNPE
jgi:hypothetical protein